MDIVKELDIVREFASLVAEAGGTAYFVGGCVRDAELRRGIKDFDIEVHNMEPSDLSRIIRRIAEPLAFGKSFGIYSIPGTHIDIAVPRIERKTGEGHRGFDIKADPGMGTYLAAIRRDFTINSMMKNILTGEITDHFGGREDIERKLVRHIDEDRFVEDPLRVLRAARFASVLGFEIDPVTVELCRTVDLSNLSRERIEQELRKALLDSPKPSVFFESLRDMGQLSHWFPELEKLIGVEQNPKYHPEGDVWVHTMEVLDRAAAFRDEVSDAFAFMLFVLSHDFGKITATSFVNGAIHAYKHEFQGAEIAETFLKRFVGEKAVIRYVLNMIPLHMRPNVSAFARSSVKSTNHMFDDASAPEDLIYFAMSDKPVMAEDVKFEGDKEFLFERLAIYRATMDKPYVSGKDLIDAGLEPGIYFNEALAYAHKLRLAQVDKESALKQTLSYVRKYQAKNKGE